MLATSVLIVMTEFLNNQSLLLVFLFAIGLAVGSFVNVLVLRLNTGLTLRGRSRCFSCLERLKWYDLIPLVSYASIRGRCRYCRSKISFQYPIVEILTGIIFLSVGYITSPVSILPWSVVPVVTSYQVLRYLLASAFFTTLLAISVYDIRHKIIPDQLSSALLAIAVLYELNTLYAFFDRETFKLDIMSAFGAFLFFAGLWFLSQGRWMGFGDAKIAFPIGLFLGHPWTIIAILFAFWSGAIIGITMLVLKKYTRKSEVPFAPFLAFGAFVGYLFAGTDILMWYYSSIGL